MSDQRQFRFPSRIGVFLPADPYPSPESQAVARDIEEPGFGSVLLPKVPAGTR